MISTLWTTFKRLRKLALSRIASLQDSAAEEEKKVTVITFKASAFCLERRPGTGRHEELLSEATPSLTGLRQREKLLREHAEATAHVGPNSFIMLKILHNSKPYI